ncbi:MAG: hypothetical protein LBD58_01625 [Treponema sp.]|nr:hypothetical protein [Treponema sp.]
MVECKRITTDSRRSSAETMRCINKRKKAFIFEMKESREATTSEEDREKGQF